MQTMIVIDKPLNENESFILNASFSKPEASTRAPLAANSSDWGPRRDPLAIVIPITIVYALTFVSGVVGNVSTCIVIARNKSMHTATNYYLFSLAISDLLLLVSGLPPEIYLIWSRYPYIFGEAFCVMQGFAAETSANATVLTITAFTVERYVAICHPFLSHTLSKLNRAIKFIVAIWMVAMCLAIPQAMAFGLVYERLPDGRVVEEHCVCTVKRFVIPHAFEISTFVFFVAPMSLITVLYVLIGLQLHRSTVRPSRGNSVKLKHRVYKQINPSIGGGENVEKKQEEEGRKNFAKNAQATKHVVKMLVAVVVAFFICWAPFHAQRLLAIYGEQTSAGMIRAFQILTYVSGIFFYLSTTVNPLLYHIMSHKFREAFKATYKQCFRRGHRTPGGRCYSTLSGRSSQVNSHSNTDSYSRQSSLRYLDAEMARLHDSRRPLVVSFRRKKPPTLRRPKQVTIFDSELQNTLTTLNAPEKNIPVVEVHSLQPTHICPLSVLKLEEFDEEQKRNARNKTRTGSWNCEERSRENGLMTKSCTMPEMRNKIFDERNERFLYRDTFAVSVN
ncbi:neuromedin-U receptor 2-like isoform X1 [Tribolium castaneum]|uniref:Pyrokinin 1 receptor B n=2 Tax=Tribolium castaneum TaxID=7070 RepID=A0A0A7H8P0_TRICA|nr:PREDICTED: neuromedin-U receptor 2-like isoform X1 [Tribolium castaneum]XP_015839434.1 PREDICTED: neuromedin-U receptor 2-like isoform X1 [Tribolium castaneum]XP_015839435.1 PREDICTED: neuromedin-U receptor 2-like isoform X1 [Tribolium castaneum]AIZ00519.1 pyrokinin 1 receptor B [Tribolium castaneum]|eukprot:XP_015839433.1 PREDICTED: neuromedin-U receptor 2-like isoform X1 [Tribolium castaneum]